MFRSALQSSRSIGQRCASTSIAPKAVDSLSVEVSESAAGSKLASIAEPTGMYKGMTRIVAAFNAGPRHERLSEHRGVSHLLRRSCGLSTKKMTQVNLTRHLNQMGATLSCTATREQLVYSLDVPTCFARRGAEIFSSVPSDTLFFHWELKDTANQLMQYDVQLLNRRHLNLLTLELLHEAAFGTHPEGTGLGNSLFAPESRISWYNEKDILSYTALTMRPENMCLAVVGHPDGQHLLGDLAKSMEFLDSTEGSQYKAGMKTFSGNKYGFVGGEIRRSNHLASSNNLMIGWPTSGQANKKEHFALAVASKILSGPVRRIPYYNGNDSSRINKPVGGGFAGDSDTAKPMDVCLASGLHQSYSDAGIFGVAMSASCPHVLAEKAAEITKQLRTPFTDAEVAKGKAMLKFDIGECAESTLEVANDLAVQTLQSGGKAYANAATTMGEVDTVSMNDVNEAVKKALSSPKVAMAVVGVDAHIVPPVSEMIKA